MSVKPLGALIVTSVFLFTGGVSYFGYINYQSAASESPVVEEDFGEYAYRCGDGSEFYMIPRSDMGSIRLVPATSVDYIRETVLYATSSQVGALFAGEGVTFHGSGETVTVDTTKTEPTTCHPIHLPDEAPINFGD